MDVVYFDWWELFLDQFANSIFTNLDVFEAFGSHVVGPLDEGWVVVINLDGAIGEQREDVEIGEDVGDVLEGFSAVVCGPNFGFGGATSSEGLPFGFPMDCPT